MSNNHNFTDPPYYQRPNLKTALPRHPMPHHTMPHHTMPRHTTSQHVTSFRHHNTAATKQQQNYSKIQFPTSPSIIQPSLCIALDEMVAVVEREVKFFSRTKFSFHGQKINNFYGRIFFMNRKLILFTNGSFFTGTFF